MHAGAGGAGSAALQLGVHAGARVIATAGSPEKTNLCLELGAELAINYRETDFVEAVLDATDGRGVDVAFDAVSGDVTLQTFRCMAFNGRHILAGLRVGHRARRRRAGAAAGAVRELLARRRVPRVRRRSGRVQAAERLQLPGAPRRRATARRAAGPVRGGQAPRDRRPGRCRSPSCRPRSTRWSNARPSAVPSCASKRHYSEPWFSDHSTCRGRYRRRGCSCKCCAGSSYSHRRARRE